MVTQAASAFNVYQQTRLLRCPHTDTHTHTHTQMPSQCLLFSQQQNTYSHLIICFRCLFQTERIERIL